MNRNDNLINQATHKFIPSNKSITIIYWSFVIIVGSLGLIFSCLKGYFQKIGNDHYFDICQNLLLALFGFSHICEVYCFIKYGKLLVGLLNESVELLEGNDSPSILSMLNQYKTYLKKVNINRLTFILKI